MENFLWSNFGIFLVSIISFLFGYFLWEWVKGLDYMRTHHPDYKGMDLFGEDESLEDTKLRYIKAGIEESKIYTTEASAMTVYGDKWISLHIRTELTKEDVEEINKSDGIIVTNKVYGKSHFRYGFIKK